ncbi:MAG: phosphate propanoyltransferase [Clostridia bacterium]|nr:phosphate propanoyltransferase [Clostridia bacterium]
MENLKILVETSARHVHLSAEHMAVLFGEGAKLTLKRELSQPGQFLSEERVSIVGPKSRMDNVAVLGPERKATQVELSLTDARALGVTAPVRESGDVAGSGSITVVGPKGSVELAEGVIAAKRHIHLQPQTAEKYGLENGQTVKVTVEGARALTYDEVVIRVSEKFADTMHVDIDEANAAGLSGVVYGIVTK